MSDPIQETRARLLEEKAILCLRLAEGGETLLEACRAAARGGLRVLEITLTTPGAIEAIGALAEEPDLLVGAGTVLTVDEVVAVAEAGGRFALSPILDPEIVAAAHDHGLLAVPGAATPTEIQTAHRQGADLVKVFPSGPLGGPEFLRWVRGPLPHVPLVPTSGPTAENLHEYLAAGAAAVGVGKEIFPPGWTLDHVEFAARRVREAVDRV